MFSEIRILESGIVVWCLWVRPRTFCGEKLGEIALKLWNAFWNCLESLGTACIPPGGRGGAEMLLVVSCYGNWR